MVKAGFINEVVRFLDMLLLLLLSRFSHARRHVF